MIQHSVGILYEVNYMNMLKAYTKILQEELKPAMGCTEPIAIAYAASVLRNALNAVPEKMEIHLSRNIIKNVKSVIVPATGGMNGIKPAVAAGVIANAPEKQLEVLIGLNTDDIPLIKSFIEQCDMKINELESDKTFEVKIYASSENDSAFVHLSDRHTNVISVIKNGQDITKEYSIYETTEESEHTNRDILTIEKIIEYAKIVPLETVQPLIKRQIDMNMTIAKEGIANDYGASIGKLLYKDGNCSPQAKACALAAAGSDARMSGCELPVCIISGSGNQGICASVPLIVYAKEKGYTEEDLIRALIVSNLITIHQKTGIGYLSAYCGAISAGCGCACGICFLDGGGYDEISQTFVNSVAILSGTICDGAKPSCAAKIAMAVEAGFMGYEMIKLDKKFFAGDGIVGKGVENTIQNVGRLAREGMSETDKEIIKIMLN